MEENILIKTFKSNESNIFLTGPAGSGKSYIVKDFIKWFRNIETYGDLEVLAPTAIAALNIGGKTLASFFKTFIFNNVDEINLKNYKKGTIAWSFISKISVIVVDEISMVSDDYLTLMDLILKTVHKNHKPFGGVRMIFIGDFLQLPPIDKKEYWDKSEVVKKWAFKAPVWKEAKIHTITLSENKRQDDKEFISHLWDIRTGNISKESIDYFRSKQTVVEEFQKKIVRLYATNKEVNAHNDYYFKEIKQKTITFNAEINDFVDKETFKNAKKLCEQLKPLDNEVINVKLGARMMLIANISGAKNVSIKKLVNGLIGTVVGIKVAHQDVIFLKEYENKIKDVKIDKEGVYVHFDDLDKIQFIERYEWTLTTKPNYKDSNKELILDVFGMPKEPVEGKETKDYKVIAGFSQIPLKLAYAFTIHKAQGLTFNYLYIDFKSFFEVNHAYVALSRIKDINKSYLVNIEYKHLKIDNEALNFVNNLKEGK